MHLGVKIWVWWTVYSMAEATVPECTVDPWIATSAHKGATALARNFSAYEAPRLSWRQAGGQKAPFFVRGSTALVFVHLSKCGGTSLKRIFAAAIRQLGLGAPYTLFRRTWPKFAQACATGSADCARDLYVGTNSLGACELINKERCAYVTVLREPVSRLVSSYRYFCSHGAENKKGWQRGWKSCRWSLQDWAALQPALATFELSTFQAPKIPIAPARQSQDCPLLADAPASERKPARARAHLDAALSNISPNLGGPIFALALETLSEGLRHLSTELGLPLLPLQDKLNADVAAEQQPNLGDDQSTRIRQLLQLDLALYAAVRAQQPPMALNRSKILQLTQ